LENRSALEVEVAPAPLGKLIMKRYVVKGDVQRLSYHRWLKKRALERNLHGFVKNMVFDEIEIVVAATDRKKIEEFKSLITGYPQGSRVEKIEEENYTEPVTIGFEIAERYNISSLKSTQYALRKMEKELNYMRKQKHRAEKDNQHILNSTSWKVTEPLRKIGALVKRK